MRGSKKLVQEPLKLGSIVLRNRLVFAPFETNYATPDSFPTEKHYDLYRRIAAGGVALIVLEATNVNPTITPTKFGLSISRDDYIPHLKKLTDAIHEQGAHVIIQIADKTALEEGRYATEMEAPEIERLIGYFVDAIVRSEKAGFDGVDFHAAHLYTLADFLSLDRNKRTDAYSKTLKGRVQILKDIYLRAKDKVSPGFIFGCRYNGDEFMNGGNTLKDAMAIGQELEKLGFDLLDISAGGRIEPIFKTGAYGGWGDSYSAARCIPGAGYPDAVNIHLAEGVKKAVKKTPVIGCGKIGNVRLAEQLLREKKVDLVGMARAIFCDPELPNKSFSGKENEVVKCSWCNVCHRLYTSDREVVCSRWPGVKVKL
jgi:2,4-dienoyl-CoA reductase-like NADH-dependent reductase (Old Yellow Enzyme family)